MMALATSNHISCPSPKITQRLRQLICSIDPLLTRLVAHKSILPQPQSAVIRSKTLCYSATNCKLPNKGCNVLLNRQLSQSKKSFHTETATQPLPHSPLLEKGRNIDKLDQGHASEKPTRSRPCTPISFGSSLESQSSVVKYLRKLLLI